MTDHKLLTTIFHPHKRISATASPRIQRCALFLSGFSYQIEYKNTEDHANADGLSRLPLNCTRGDKDRKDPADVFHLNQIHKLPVTVKELRKETRNNPILATVIQAIMSGWPAKQQLHPDLLPYFHKREEMAVHDGCLLWGGQATVLPKLQQHVLEELHEGHVGIVKMKALARSYFLWPGLDSQIESTCRTCEGSALTQNNPPAAPVNRWEFPKKTLVPSPHRLCWTFHELIQNGQKFTSCRLKVVRIVALRYFCLPVFFHSAREFMSSNICDFISCDCK